MIMDNKVYVLHEKEGELPCSVVNIGKQFAVNESRLVLSAVWILHVFLLNRLASA